MFIPRPRRKLVVNREVQFDILMYVGLLTAFLFVLQVVTAIVFLNQLEGMAKNMSAMEFLSKYKISFLVYQGVVFGVCMIVSIFVFNRFSSRIAGPIYNMRRTLRKFQQNPSVPLFIHLRKNDYFKDEINDVNAMLKRKNLN
ncbi:MAG: HAMP domain-containing protein [Bdellovibrio sp.]